MEHSLRESYGLNSFPGDQDRVQFPPGAAFFSMNKPANVLITGSDYWNPGDSVVREGCMALLRAAYFPRPVNWHFFDFSRPHNAVGPCGEVANVVELPEIRSLAPHIDLVVIPGLAFGRELSTFQQEILNQGLGPKTVFIGGMNENPYADEWAAKTHVRRLLKQAKLVIGRTQAHPETMRRDGVAYKCLACPSLLSDSPRPRPCLAESPRLAVSIQLPHGSNGAVVNHSTGAAAHDAARSALETVCKDFGPDTEVRLVCHHKSEFRFWAPHFAGHKHVRVYWSSWFQDLWAAYSECEAVFSTRLHSVLWCRAMGIPGIVINGTPRHQEALREIPGTPSTLSSVTGVVQFLRHLQDPVAFQEIQDSFRDHRDRLWSEYFNLLAPIVK